MDAAAELTNLRAPKAQFIAALANIGAKRDGRSLRFTLPSGVAVVLFQRGRNSYGLSVTNELDAYWAGSIVESVRADYRAGNVTTIVA